MIFYIIGNGFDIAHNLKTSYSCFREYLKKYHEEFLVELEKLYGFYPIDEDDPYAGFTKDAIKEREESIENILWGRFEENLGKVDEDEIYGRCKSAVKDLEEGLELPVQIGDTLNTYFDKEYRFIQDLQEYLLKWVRQIRLNKAPVKRKKLLTDADDLFLTFNYTPTLERVYGIKSSQVCHIHGGYSPYCSLRPIIGHANKNAIEQQRKWQHECDEKFEEGEASIHKAIADFYERTLKDTDKYIGYNASFLNRAQNADSIEVIGQSIENVDQPYYKYVLSLAGRKIPWTIYYYVDPCTGDSTEGKLRSKAIEIGIKNFSMKNCEEFWT